MKCRSTRGHGRIPSASGWTWLLVALAVGLTSPAAAQSGAAKKTPPKKAAAKKPPASAAGSAAKAPTKPAAADAAWKRKLEARLEALQKSLKKLQADQARRAAAAAKKDSKELRRHVAVLTEELQRLKLKLVLPEKEKLKSVFGLGPAASKVYGVQQGLSIGGYGEFYFGLNVGDTNSKSASMADFYRYIQYIGYKFNDKLLVNAEVEVEHSTTGAGGEVSLEFAYIDYLMHPRINIRAGMLLMPMGWINELHEPPFYHGNLRPEIERRIIPSTWRELGFGIFGQLAPGLTYKLYATTGFDASKFGPGGWRSGRQKGARARLEDFAGLLRLRYNWRSILTVGVTGYVGGADQNRFDDVDVTAILLEGHAQFRYRGLELRALGIYGMLLGARDLTLAVFPDADPPSPLATELIASRLYGWYVEAAYDIWGALSTMPLYLAPFVRLEVWDTQASVPDIAGYSGRVRDRAQARRILDVGLTFKPHPQVVVKVNYRNYWNAAGVPQEDALYFGAGFMY